MKFEHLGASPRIHPDAVVAPTAVISGDVEIGAGLPDPARRGDHGRRRRDHPRRERHRDGERAHPRDARPIPSTSATTCSSGRWRACRGATVGDEVFLATGTRVFNGARIGERSEVRINAVVHLRTVLAGRDRRPDRVGRRRRSGADPAAGPARGDLGGAARTGLPGLRLRPRSRHARPHGAAHRALRPRPRAARRRPPGRLTSGAQSQAAPHSRHPNSMRSTQSESHVPQLALGARRSTANQRGSTALHIERTALGTRLRRHA